MVSLQVYISDVTPHSVCSDLRLVKKSTVQQQSLNQVKKME